MSRKDVAAVYGGTMGDQFAKYMLEALNGGEGSKKLLESYDKISAQSKVVEDKMNELYTAIDGLDEEEARRFSGIYEEFNKLLVEFQDMILTVQGIINDGGTDDGGTDDAAQS